MTAVISSFVYMLEEVFSVIQYIADLNGFSSRDIENQSAEGAGGLGIIRSNKVGETE